MSEIDIRKEETPVIKSIRFADTNRCTQEAHALFKIEGGGFTITGAQGREVSIKSGQRLADMKAAIAKAEELGWV